MGICCQQIIITQLVTTTTSKSYHSEPFGHRHFNSHPIYDLHDLFKRKFLAFGFVAAASLSGMRTRLGQAPRSRGKPLFVALMTKGLEAMETRRARIVECVPFACWADIKILVPVGLDEACGGDQAKHHVNKQKRSTV